MKPRSRWMIPALVGVLCLVAAMAYADEADETEPASPAGPTLMAIDVGQGYTIHAFRGMVVDEQSIAWQRTHRYRRQVRAGVALLHHDTEAGELRWGLQTGTFVVESQVRVWHATRLVGLYHSDAVMVAVIYSYPTTEQPPEAPDPAAGDYTLMLIAKRTGVTDYAFPDANDNPLAPNDLPWTHRPEEVPAETLGHGLIQPTDEGFHLLGVQFTVDEDGSIEQVLQSQEPESEQEDEQEQGFGDF